MNQQDKLSDQQVFENLHAENDPVLRSEVRAALKKRSADRIDPFILELSLRFGGHRYERRQAWFEKKNRLHARLRKNLRAMSKADPKKWPRYAQEIVDGVLRGSGYGAYDKHRLSDWCLENQPHPDTFLQALQNGEDPATLVLSICNIWMSKATFITCANLLGNELLLWDDNRNLIWADRMRNRPENLHLCDDMSVQRAGIVAVEPFKFQTKDVIDYGLYGSTVADVTSFVVRFTPKAGVNPRDLMQHVEAAVNDFIENGNETFEAPTCHYNNPDNAYDRPRLLEKEEFWNPDHMALQLAYEMEEKFPEIVRDYEKSYYEKPESEEHLFMLYKTQDVVKDYIFGKMPEKDFPQEMQGYLDAYIATMRTGHHAYIADNGDVVLKKTLILDDVIELYKFCDTFLTPGPAIANALNAARFAEECGPVKTSGDLSDLHNYASANVTLEERLGNLDNVSPEQIIDKAQNDVLVMLGMKQSTLQTAFLQVATLSHGTLEGLLPDGTGEYPSLRQITDGSKNGALEQQDKLLADRARSMIERMTGRYGFTDAATPLKDRFLQAAEMAADLARHQEKIDAICDYYFKSLRSYKPDQKQGSLFSQLMEKDYAGTVANERIRALGDLKAGENYEPESNVVLESVILGLSGKTDKPVDVIEEMDHKTPPPAHLDSLGRYMWWCCMSRLQDIQAEEKGERTSPKREKPSRAVKMKADLAKWGGEIGLQLPRGFKETLYITRNSHTPFARPGTELPRELEKYAQRDNGTSRPALPDMSVVFMTPKPKP